MVLGWLWLVGLAPATDVSSKRPSDLERGETLYKRHCTSCHGSQAHGDGPATAALVHPVPDLAQKVKSSDPFVDIVIYGAGAMPGFELSFDRSDARKVLKYMAIAHDKGEPQAPEGAEPAEAVEPEAAPEEEEAEEAVDGQQIGPGE